MGCDWEKHLNAEIQKIEILRNEGYTTQDILDKNEFSYEALKACGLPVSYLVPKIEGQKMNPQEWDTHTSSEHKWELLNGIPFGAVRKFVYNRQISFGLGRYNCHWAVYFSCLYLSYQ